MWDDIIIKRKTIDDVYTYHGIEGIDELLNVAKRSIYHYIENDYDEYNEIKNTNKGE